MKRSLNELKMCLQSYIARLPSLQATEQQRQRKRVLQHIGKLNKQIKVLEEESSKETELMSSDSTIIANERRKMPRKKVKAILKSFHDELQDFAKNKQLTQAIKKFERMKKEGFELNEHSYGNMINVCVRCNAIDQMDVLMRDMALQHIPLNIVIITTAIKGQIFSSRIPSSNY